MKVISRVLELFTESSLTKKLIFLLLSLVTIEGAVLLVNFGASKSFLPKENTRLKNEALQILKKCAGEPYHLVCYNNEVPKILGEVSLRDAFEVTRIIQVEDPTFGNCHVVAHKLVGKALEKDINKWQEVLTSCRTNICQSGCVHGVILAKFKAERLTDTELNSLLKELTTTCESNNVWHPTLAEKYSCYHGLGHLFMYATGADLKKTPALCSQITKGLDRSFLMTCLAGTFMQLYRFVDTDDMILVKDVAPKNKAEVDKLCGKFSNPNYYQACYFESWPIALKDPLNPENLTRFCSFTDDDYALEYCYRSVINQLAEVFAFNQNKIDKVNDYCGGLSGKWQGLCYGFASAHLVYIDPKYAEKAVSICSQAPSQYENNCFEALTRLSSSNFEPKSGELSKFCETLPTPWKERCLN